MCGVRCGCDRAVLLFPARVDRLADRACRVLRAYVARRSRHPQLDLRMRGLKGTSRPRRVSVTVAATAVGTLVVLAILGVASALGSSPLKRTAPPAAAQSPAAAQPPAESTNLLQNADLSLGGGNSPEHWRSEGWVDKPEATTYTWIHPAGGAAGELEVDNLQ